MDITLSSSYVPASFIHEKLGEIRGEIRVRSERMKLALPCHKAAVLSHLSFFQA
jgi:hypothetical protein